MISTTCRTTDELTSFIITGLAPEHEDAALSFYQQTADGFEKTYLSTTPNLHRIYQNYARCAEEMVLQTAGAIPVPWEQSLLAFITRIGHVPIDWWLTGSGALAVRGLEIVPRDLDIVTDKAGAHKLGELFLDYLVEPVVESKGWIANWFGRAFIYSRIEWVGDVVKTVDTPQAADFGPAAADRLETVTWQGKKVRIPPLNLQLQVSIRRGLVDRAAKIEQFMGTGGY